MRREDARWTAFVDALLPPRRTLQRRDLMELLAPMIIKDSLPLPSKDNPKQSDDPSEAIRNGAARVLRAYGYTPQALFSLALPDIDALAQAVAPLEAADADRIHLAVALRNNGEQRPSDLLLGSESKREVSSAKPSFSADSIAAARRVIHGGKQW